MLVVYVCHACPTRCRIVVPGGKGGGLEGPDWLWLCGCRALPSSKDFKRYLGCTELLPD